MSECVVYWKHLKDMSSDYTDGYIGISKNFEERQRQHHRDAFVRNSIYTVHERMRMYGDNIQTSIIFEGSINDCFDYEEELRPRWHMGWNMAIGGGRPGSGWKPSLNWLDNRLYHPKHGERIICNKYKTTDMAKEFNLWSNDIANLLSGRFPKLKKKWEFANEQLARKVMERHRKPWNHIYLKKHEVVSLYLSGSKQFANYCNKNPSGFSIKHVANGTLKTLYGWELATKEEWLASKERKEFK